MNFFSIPPKYICFEDVLYAIKNSTTNILINTLPSNEQSVLIKGTIKADNEERKVNELLSSSQQINIILYGKNATDETVETKRKQLLGLGFGDVYIYRGGLFEWCLLQDIYGTSNFETDGVVKDMLLYKGKPLF